MSSLRNSQLVNRQSITHGSTLRRRVSVTHQRRMTLGRGSITVNPLLSPPPPPGDLFFSSTFEGGGGLLNLAKHITCSKNTVVSDRVELHVVQLVNKESTGLQCNTTPAVSIRGVTSL